MLVFFLVLATPASRGRESGRVLSAQAKVSTAEVYMERGNFEKAMVLLKQAADEAPSYARSFSLLAYISSKQGKNNDAIFYYKAAIEADPGDEQSYANLAELYHTVGNMTEAASLYRKYLNRFPNSKYKTQTRELLEAVEAEKENFALPEAGGRSMSIDHYLLEVSAGKPHRWAKEKMPIRVHIKTPSSGTIWKTEYDEILKKAFLSWQNSSNGAISIEFVPEEARAQIICKWTSKSSDLEGSSEQGLTRSQTLGDEIKKAEITILTCLLSNSRAAAPLTLITHVALHEIGHALGITGHSPNPKDVMYFVATRANRNVIELSARDRKTIQLMYSQSPGFSNALTTAVNPNKPHSYSFEEGVAYMNRKVYDSAIECFIAVLNQNPRNTDARINLGISYAGLGLQMDEEKRYEEGEKAYKLMMDVRRQIPDRHVLDAAVRNYASMLKDMRKDREAARIESEI